jgi:hypothetical protein
MIINLKEKPTQQVNFNFLGADPAFGDALKRVVDSLFRAPMIKEEWLYTKRKLNKKRVMAIASKGRWGKKFKFNKWNPKLM